MAKKPSAEPEAPFVTPDIIAGVSRLLTDIINTPSCHNFHAEAAILRDLIGIVSPEKPETEQPPAKFSDPSA